VTVANERDAPRTIERIYPLVSYAIHRAAVLLGADRREAQREVSRLEEEIAAILPSDDDEGEIARRGAVSAALDADDCTRAIQMAERYLGEERVSDAQRSKLQSLRDQARLQAGEEDGETNEPLPEGVFVPRPGVQFRCDDLVISPQAVVDMGGELPPDRPSSDALIRIKNGVITWFVP